MSNPSVKIRFCREEHCWDSDNDKPRSANVKGKDVAKKLLEEFSPTQTNVRRKATIVIPELCQAEVGGMKCAGYCRAAPITEVTVNGTSQMVVADSVPSLIASIKMLIKNNGKL